MPLAVIARTNRWSLARTAKVSLLASLGHVSISLVLGILLAAAGLALRSAVIADEAQIVGGVLVLTGLGFLAWAMLARGHGHSRGGRHTHPYPRAHLQSHDPPPDVAHRVHAHGQGVEPHAHDHGHGHDGHTHQHSHNAHPHKHVGAATRATAAAPRRGSWLTEIAVPFGVAASPDLTILPVFLAASAVGVGAAVGTLAAFAVATLLTFVILTLAATIGGYQVDWPWLEANGHIVSALVLLVVGGLAYARV